MTHYDNSLVKGFLGTRGRDFVNGEGEKIALRGVGFGNWLLPEGYMWRFEGRREKGYMWRFEGSGADRPRRIEAALAELTGAEYAERFWKRFYDDYITEYDIKAIAAEGFNSVRIPINWRRVMKEGPGIRFIEEGFGLIDRCLDLCEKYRLYAFLDLHGAPGGQTGQNIDDSIDNMPRLFMDKDSYEKGVALWVEMAKRYKDRAIVGGYDLLNEPVRTPKDMGNVDHFVGSLAKFYTDCIAEIRKIDKKHLFSLEGHHWSTRLEIFDHRYDDNMCIHFHRYWNPPEPSQLEEYIEAGKRLNVPLWLGETGENTIEWFTVMIFMLDQLDISWNFWTWKKLDTDNSPYSINKPENYRLIQDYVKGGQHPGFEESQKIFDEYLRNMKTENCTYNGPVIKQILRERSCHVPAPAYDALPGIGKSFSGVFTGENEISYRKSDRMRFVPKNSGNWEAREDNPWQSYNLLLTSGEWADYTVRNPGGGPFEVSVLLAPCACNSAIEIFVNDTLRGVVPVQDGKGYYRQKCGEAVSGTLLTIRIKPVSGSVILDTIYFE
jgi:hypothetical protein